MSGIPAFLQSSLWSYDFKKMDPKRDRRTVITQVLNYGTTDQVKWLLRTYSDQEIKTVVREPQRGIWHPESLNFWTKIFNLKIDKTIYDMAIFSLDPVPAARWKRWYKVVQKRQEKMKHPKR